MLKTNLFYCFIFQFRIRAYRQSDPTVQAYKTIRIEVDRNPSYPAFNQTSYVFNIPENQVLENVFGKISASDPDAVRFHLIFFKNKFEHYKPI